MRFTLGLSLVFLLSLYHPAHSQPLPPGFSETIVVSGLNAPTAIAFAPDRRLFICEQGGRLRVKDGASVSDFATISVSSNSERGLLGIAFDPSFATNHYLYLYYTTNSTSLNPPPSP